jgi:hypothetical protein
LGNKNSAAFHEYRITIDSVGDVVRSATLTSPGKKPDSPDSYRDQRFFLIVNVFLNKQEVKYETKTFNYNASPDCFNHSDFSCPKQRNSVKPGMESQTGK